MSCQLNKSAGETATHVQRFRTKTDALREGWQDFLMDRTYPMETLCRCFGCGGLAQWQSAADLCPLEVQGQYDAEFAERMFVYNYRLNDRYRQPVASLAALADDQPGWRPDHFSLEALGCKHQLHTATQDQLDLWAERILLAGSVEEVFKLD